MKAKARKKPSPKKPHSPLTGLLGLLKSDGSDSAEAQRLRIEIEKTIKQIQAVGRRRDIPFEVWDLLYKLNESAGTFTWFEKVIVPHAPAAR